MPQTKSGRKKWRKKQRNLMAANQSAQIVPPPNYNSVPPCIRFVPPYNILPTPTPSPTNLSYTHIVTNNPQLQQPKPPMQIPIVQKKQDVFDLPHNCPNSLR